jgi:probable HAF family extracellular repeat protein
MCSLKRTLTIAAAALAACTQSRDPTSPLVTAEVVGGAASYEMIDLGTLLPNNRSAGSEAYGINDRGQVMGWSSTNPVDGYARGYPHAFLWDRGVMQDYGTPVPTRFTSILSFGNINAGGAFVGTFTSYPTPRAVLWVDGTVQDLGTLGGPTAAATAVNNRGQVVGTSLLATAGQHAFLWENGVMSDLGTLGGRDSRAFAINQRGQVAGYAEDAAGVWHVFLWQQGVMQDLGTVGDRPGFFAAVNDLGDVAGATGESGFFSSHGALQDLGAADAFFPVRLNDRGEVIGKAPYPGGAFLWEGGVRTDLGHLPGGDNSVAWAINDRGQVVGTSNVAPDGIGPHQYHAFVWENGQMVDLGTFPVPSVERPVQSVATAINEQGDIVGWAEVHSEIPHAVLWRRRGGGNVARAAAPE